MSDEADIASDAEELFRSAQTAVRKPAKGLDSATRIASLTTSGEIKVDMLSQFDIEFMLNTSNGLV